MSDTWQQLHTVHPRNFRLNRYVYPVLSRRSRGISVGINLNPDKICNFDCVYCQVDRQLAATTSDVDQERLLAELDALLRLIRTGEIYKDAEFKTVPADRRRLNDIAFSGDGEPTTYPGFAEIVAAVAALKKQHKLDAVKIVLITNATMLHRPHVAEGLRILDQNNGEIWAKLEAGTEQYYHAVERTKISFRQVLDNITTAAQARPIVIQSLFMRLLDVAPPSKEIGEYIQRLQEIVGAGGKIKGVQVYTVARTPAEKWVTPLTTEELGRIATQVQAIGIPAEVFAD